MEKNKPIRLEYEEAPQVDDSIPWRDVTRVVIKLALALLATLAVMAFLGLFSRGW